MEYLDIVDIQDRVIGRTSIDQIYKHKYLHRIVHILVFNDNGEILLQRRSANKEFAPLHWSTSAGGHVQSGEDYATAAKRELQEEIGVMGKLEFVGKDLFKEDKKRGLVKFFSTYKLRHNGPFNPCPRELDGVSFYRLSAIPVMLEAGDLFHPELLFLLKKYWHVDISRFAIHNAYKNAFKNKL